MIPRPSVSAVAVLLLAGSASGWSPGQTPERRSASALIMLSNPAGGPRVDAATLSALAHTSAVAGRTAKELLGSDPESYQGIVRLEVTDGRQRGGGYTSILVSLDSRTSPETVTAGDFLGTLIVHLREALGEMAGVHRAELEANVALLREERDLAAARLEQTRTGLRELRKRSGQPGMSAMELRSLGPKLRGEIEQQKRVLAMQRSAIPSAQQKAEDDAERARRMLVEEAWKEVVDRLRELLEELEQAPGEGSPDPLGQAELRARLAEAKVNMLQAGPARGLGVAINPVGGFAGARQQDPARQIEATKEYLSHLREELRLLEEVEILSIATAIEMLEREEHRQSEALAKAEQDLAEREKQLRSAGVTKIALIGE